MPDEFIRLTSIPEKDRAVLEVCHDSIDMYDWRGLSNACLKLFEGGERHLVMDLRRVGSALSFLIGTAVEMSLRAQREHRRFTVLAVGSLADVFRNALGRDVLELITDGRGPADIALP